jgi:polo-like kinase 1
VTKWVDYTSKYGLGYLLSDGSAGVYFNDSSKIILAANASNFEYMERSSRKNGVRPPDPPRNAHTLEQYPSELNKKVTLLKHFRNYLVDQQTKEGAATNPIGGASGNEGGSGSGSGAAIVAQGDEVASSDNMPYLKKWVRTRHAILFRLSNRTVQVNFFDHTEILLSSEARLVTYVDRQSKRTTFPLAAVVECPRADIAKRLKYTKDILHQLISGGHR